MSRTAKKGEVLDYAFVVVGEAIESSLGFISVNDFANNGGDSKEKYNVLMIFPWLKIDLLESEYGKYAQCVFKSLLLFDRSFLFHKHNFYLKSDIFLCTRILCSHS